MIEHLSSGDLKLQRLNSGDAKDLFLAVRASYDQISPWTSWLTEDYSLSDAENFLRTQAKNWQQGLEYVFKINNKAGDFLGCISLHVYDPNNHVASIGYWVNSQFAGQGICTAALKLLVRKSFEWLSLNRIEIIVAMDNKPSLKVAEKSGARFESIQSQRLAPNGVPCDAKMFVFIPGDNC